MTTPIYVLRCVQLGLRISELDELDLGFVIDMITELGNDDFKYKEVANQEDFDKF